ncbi:MAG: hypothetical protein U0V87_06965 [Acidobacteriota bacterium]
MKLAQHRFVTACMLAAAVLLGPSGHAAVTYMATPDVPTDLANSTYAGSQIVRIDGATATSALNLPAGAVVDAIHRRADGKWLISLESAFKLGGVLFDPRDVILVDGTTYTLQLGGASAGIPADTNLDTLLQVGSDLVVGFDVPVTIGGVPYDPADLLRYQAGTWSLYFDASATIPPIPSSTNLVGADLLGAKLVLAFDIPVTLGATYNPGDLVAWNGSAFSLLQAGATVAWPASSTIAGLALAGSPGESLNLRISKASSSQLRFTWDPSCSGNATDYGIYMGTLGSFASHAMLDCSDGGGDRSELESMPAGNKYFLVVPLATVEEGSYGTNSAGIERARGVTTCRTTRALAPCP